MKKILIAIAVIILVVIVALIAIPFLFKDKLKAKAITAINNSVNASVNFDEFGITIIKSFPNITICLGNLSVAGVGDFKGDTLADINEVLVTVDLMSVLKGDRVDVKSFTLDKPHLNLLVLENGKANWDIAKPSEETSGAESNDYKISLNHYRIIDGNITYDDRSSDFKLVLNALDHEGSGDFTQDLFTLSTTTHSEVTNAWYGNIKYLDKVVTDLKADLEMDMKNSKYTFKENELKLNGLSIGFDGYVAIPGEDISMDIKFKSNKTDFASLVSLIPGIYKNDFKQLKSSGTVAFDGMVEGVYNDNSIPGFNVNLLVQNGMFQYPSLPTSVNNVQVDLNVKNPDGVTDHTIIDMNRLHVEFGAEPFDAELHVRTPVSDPDINAKAKGKVDLGTIKNIVPLEKGTDLTGVLVADVAAKGRMSSIEKKQYQDFNASGSVIISGMNYKSSSYPNGIAINQLALLFTAEKVTLSNCDVKMGNSDLKANGTLDNFFGYYLKDEMLKGNVNLYSNLIDLNEMMSSSSTASETPDTSTMSVIEIPSNIDFTLNASVARLLYEDLIIQSLKGIVNIADQKLNMNGVTFNTLDGMVKMSGMYATKNPKQPDINFNLAASNIDIQKTWKTFLTVQKMAPIAERCNGKVSSGFKVTGKLDEHMQPELNTLTGSGSLQTGNVVVSNFEPLSKMADAVKMPQYKQLSLSNLNINFSFKNGRVDIEPFEANLAGTKAQVSGSNGFDQTIDYTVDLAIPKSQMNAQALGAVNNLLASANKAAGTTLAVPDPVHVKVFIEGTVTKPVIKTGLKDAASSVTEAVKEEVKEVIEEKVDEAKAKAKEEADKLIHDAEIKAKQLHDAAVASSEKVKKEGYAAADKLVAQAKDPISTAAAKKAAEKMKKETDASAAKIIKDADAEGKKIMDEAKKKADALLAK